MPINEIERIEIIGNQVRIDYLPSELFSPVTYNGVSLTRLNHLDEAVSAVTKALNRIMPSITSGQLPELLSILTEEKNFITQENQDKLDCLLAAVNKYIDFRDSTINVMKDTLQLPQADRFAAEMNIPRENFTVC